MVFEPPVIVIGAGPAGLTAAYELVQRGAPVVVFEQDDRVGGLARTIEHRGYRFDIGGHRFFTQVALVRSLWRSMLGDDLLTRPRLSRIYYRGRFLHYPLRPVNVLAGLGAIGSAAILLSYARVRLRPIRPEVSFADWVSNRFGRRLYRMFFKTYTEKVWGLPCERIDAQWAAQRIRGLSLRTAVLNMLWPDRFRTARTLVDRFEYPRLGPGMMWDRFRDRIAGGGGRIVLDSRVSALHHDGRRVTAVEIDRAGVRTAHPSSHVISTLPIPHLVAALTPPPPREVAAAAASLKFRDFLTVALIVNEADVFPDNWIYVHDESVRVGRIQNFKNWSPDLVPDRATTCLGLEYFCAAGDGLWARSDPDLIDLAARELAALGLARRDSIVDGVVVRVPRAYPVYDEGYLDRLAVVREYLARFENLQLVGRNGMHRYNNQDHSMLTAMLAVRNLFGERHDLWAVNADADYHEAGVDDADPGSVAAEIRAAARTQPSMPTTVRADASAPRLE